MFQLHRHPTLSSLVKPVSLCKAIPRVLRRIAATHWFLQPCIYVWQLPMFQITLSASAVSLCTDTPDVPNYIASPHSLRQQFSRVSMQGNSLCSQLHSLHILVSSAVSLCKATPHVPRCIAQHPTLSLQPCINAWQFPMLPAT